MLPAGNMTGRREHDSFTVLNESFSVFAEKISRRPFGRLALVSEFDQCEDELERELPCSYGVLSGTRLTSQQGTARCRSWAKDRNNIRCVGDVSRI
jgi:hypothetical protein